MIRDVVEVVRAESAVGQRARPSIVTRPFSRSRWPRSFRIRTMWWPMMPDCEWVATTAPPSFSTSIGEILRRPGVGRSDLFRIAGVANRSRQRDLSVRNQLFVVLERIIIVGPAGACPIAPLRAAMLGSWAERIRGYSRCHARRRPSADLRDRHAGSACPSECSSPADRGDRTTLVHAPLSVILWKPGIIAAVRLGHRRCGSSQLPPE